MELITEINSMPPVDLEIAYQQFIQLKPKRLKDEFPPLEKEVLVYRDGFLYIESLSRSFQPDNYFWHEYGQRYEASPEDQWVSLDVLIRVVFNGKVRPSVTYSSPDSSE